MKSETTKKVTEGIVRGHVLDTAGCTDKAADELEKVLETILQWAFLDLLQTL